MSRSRFFWDKFWRDRTMKGVGKAKYMRWQAGMIVLVVEHLQSQRLRTMFLLMASLEGATRGVDIYIIGKINYGRNTSTVA